MARPQRALLFGVWALQVALAGCSNSRRLPSPSFFNSPGDVALACFDEQPGSDERVVLPLPCCASDVEYPGCPDELDHRLRHALVTQTQRGEVAAVDLVHAKVLDSERRVPGYTFVDVGGLPAAIVVPPTLPGRTQHGPPWTYVAGREVRSIRAIATCRFRLGDNCGPETQGMIDLDDPTRMRAQTEVTLPEPPNDMVLDPSGKALWVSLPNAALIARIDLAEPSDGSTGDPPFVWPFATDDDSGMPRPPTYFQIPGGIDVAPEEPIVVAGDDEYRSVCGTGYDFVASPADLPRAPRAASSLRALPTRLRLLPREPGVAEDKQPKPVLFVADPGQSVLHAFSIVDGGLERRGVLAVGAPLRDFVLTAQVPALAPKFDALVHPDKFAYETPPANDTRYLFGIDERDDSVMAFELGLSEQALSLKPLVAPVPARQEVDFQRYARDRLMFDGIAARALEIVDTRYRALAEWTYDQESTEAKNRDALYCGKLPLTELDDAIDDAKDDGEKEELKKLEAIRDWTELGARSDVLRGVFLIVASSEGRLSVIDVHDLDLQCRARAGCVPGPQALDENKKPIPGEFEPGDPKTPSEDSSASALVLRRHARRVITAEVAKPLITSPDELAGFPGDEGPQDGEEPNSCPGGYYEPPDQRYPVCVSSDPWQTRNMRWNVVYEGATSLVGNVLLAREEGADRITLWGPQEWDFCARGANTADRLKVAIVSRPDPDIKDCDTHSYGSEPELFVVEAYRDHLVLAEQPPELGGEGDPDGGEGDPDGGEADPDAGEGDPDAGEPDPDEADPDAGVPDLDAGEPDGGDPEAGAGGEEAGAAAGKVLDELMHCYPGFATAEVRLHDQFLVTYTSGTTTGAYVHRNYADDTGLCVANEELDARVTSRIRGPDWEFQDFALAFKLANPEGDRDEIAPIIELTSQSSYLGVLNVDSTSGRSDALPSRVRFFPGSDDLFIVDGASQGLRRYELEPFQHDGERFR